MGAILDEDAAPAWETSAAGCIVAVAMDRSAEARIGARRAIRTACMANGDDDENNDEDGADERLW